MSAVSCDDGFTLVELLMSLALTAMVMVLTVPFAHTQKRLWENQEQRRESNRSLAGALAWLTRDLQQAGYHNPESPVRTLSPATLAYVVSRDEDDPAEFSSSNQRLITVWLDGSDLKYKIQSPLDPSAVSWSSGSTQVLASGITGMSCRGLDRAGAETATAVEVSLVECTLSGAAGMQERALVRLRPGDRGSTP